MRSENGIGDEKINRALKTRTSNRAPAAIHEMLGK